jgi:hypothetical protein
MTSRLLHFGQSGGRSSSGLANVAAVCTGMPGCSIDKSLT